MSTKTDQSLPLVGVVYRSGEPGRDALKDFALSLRDQGINIHGLIQQNRYDALGRKIAIDAISLTDLTPFLLARPGKEDIANGTCAFEESKLTDTSAVLRAAIDQKADLIVIEKFGEREQKGGGLLDEMMQCAIESIPTLVAVPEKALPLWRDITGDLGSTLPMKQDALESWWQTHAKL